MRSSDRPDDRSATTDSEATVTTESDATVATEDTVLTEAKDNAPTEQDVAPEPMPIVPEQISPENAAFVALGVALTVIVIVTAI